MKHTPTSAKSNFPPSNPTGPSLRKATIPENLLGFAMVRAGGLVGLDFQQVTVEVASRRGPSFFQLAGLAETAVREARIRIASALSRHGITMDEYALTVNLAPANVRKSGSGLDLAIALAILGATGEVSADALKDAIYFGEVALDGSIRAIPGVLPLLEGARNQGVKVAFVPARNSREAAQISALTVYPVSSLDELVDHLSGTRLLPALRREEVALTRVDAPDLEEVRGQAAAKRALVVAAAGSHNLLLIGPPGSGKSLLARRLPGLLPPLSEQETLETTAIHSIAGLISEDLGAVRSPPFRAPHHTVSEAGLIGGGSIPRPGEVSLAHNGVLFLDELPEFRRPTLESLRQPLEDHTIRIVRSRSRTRFPARPLLVAAMNPCPCGNWGNPRNRCRCRAAQRSKYLSRISGPLLDRIDLHVSVPPVDLRTWSMRRRAEVDLNSERARTLVDQARAAQIKRAESGEVNAPRNSQLTLKELERVASPDRAGRELLEAAIDRDLLSARGYVRVLRIARTLADLAGVSTSGAPQIGEALRYRMSDLSEI